MGVYPLTFASLFLGEPSTVAAAATLSEAGVDLSFALSLGYDTGAIASLTSTMTAWSPRTASIATDRGRLDFPAPFHHPTKVTWQSYDADPDFAGAERGRGDLRASDRDGSGTTRRSRWSAACATARPRARWSRSLRGHVQRLAVAALPRRRREAGVPPAWWDTYVQVNKRFAEKAAEVAAEGRDRLGARLPAAAGAGDAAPAAPDLTIGFFLHIPFPPYELFTAAAVAAADPRGAARRRPGRLPAAPARAELRPAGPPAARPAPPAHLIDLRRPHGAARAFPISIDVGASTSWPAPGGAGAGQGDPQGARQPEKIILGVDRLDYTKGIGVRLNAFEELLAEALAVEAPTPCSCRWPRPAASGSSTTCTLRETIEQQVGHINGVFGRSPAPAVHYFTSRCRARSWPRSTGPPTSCW
jgi:hypothetical protein